MPIQQRVYFDNDKQAFEALAEGRNIQLKKDAQNPDGYWAERTHEGRVLALREENRYDDSDFYALVWSDEKQQPVEVLYGTTRAPTYENWASVDATTWVAAKYEAWKREQARLRAEALEAREKRTVRKGKRVRVVGGRKVPIGTVGTVHWIGEGIRGRERVGLTGLDGVAYWTDARNVEVLLEEAV